MVRRRRISGPPAVPDEAKQLLSDPARLPAGLDEERREEPDVVADDRRSEADDPPFRLGDPEALGVVLEHVRVLPKEHVAADGSGGSKRCRP